MARFLQTLLQPPGSLKYFTSFKVAFRIQIRKKRLYFKNLFRKTEKKWWSTSHRIAFCSVSQYYTV